MINTDGQAAADRAALEWVHWEANRAALEKHRAFVTCFRDWVNSTESIGGQLFAAVMRAYEEILNDQR